jgi:hypothetical protein
MPISIKLGFTYHPWLKEILNCCNGPGPLQRGDDLKNAKMGWGCLKIFLRTTEPEDLKFI